ncbi:MAG: beta-propeller fold lactonase family protein [Terracidiphilus sp.]
MRMRLNKSSQLMLAGAASLLAAGLLTACNQLTGTLTVDFVYVSSALAAGPNNYGEIDVFEINSESGQMRQIPTSPFPSGGRNPVAEAVSPDQTNLYVVNEDDNTIVQFVIGNDGKVYPQNTVNTPGVFPLAVAVGGKTLFVADTYQPLPTCSPAAPCAGSIAAYPIDSNDSLGTPFNNSSISTQYWPLTLPSATTDVVTPTAIAVMPGGASVFVTAYDTTTNAGYVFGFAVGSDRLTPMNGGVPFSTGIHPAAITADPRGSYLYVADSGANNILGFSVGSSGLTPLSGSPFRSGNKPDAMVIDGKGQFAYVANAQDSNITAYSISNGVLTRISSYSVGTQPVAIGIDPAMNQFLFTANFLGNSVTGFVINAADGTLLDSQFSPYKANTDPTAVAAIPHGAVANQ